MSEVVNILKHGVLMDRSSNIILGLFMLDNVKVHGVGREAYFAATELGEDLKLDSNDALAVDFMRLNSISEIYTFDEDFDKIDRITRLPKS